MTTTTVGAAESGPWYVLQDPPSGGWPDPVAAPGGQAEWLKEPGANPTLVATDSLSGPAGVLTPEVVAALDDALSGATLTLDSEVREVVMLDGTVREVATVRVEGLTAATALAILTDPGTVGSQLDGAVASLELVPLYFVGEPFAALDGKVLASAKSPFAGVAREAVLLLNSAARGPVREERAPARRPVVAIIDSGVGGHPWLPGSDADHPVPAGEAVVRAATAEGWRPLVGLPLPAPDHVGPTRFAGHGTFVAGMIHEEAPEAQILSLHVMDGHGVSHPENVVGALQWLLERVQGGVPAEFVDVVCLAFGYYEAHPENDDHTTQLRQLLGDLGQAGVQVVVAAGNDNSVAPSFPAAFTHLSPGTLPEIPLVSVGALNPDGSPAGYSNSGPWVRHEEVGSGLVSTVPIAFDQITTGVDPGEFDPNHTCGGLVRWGGTSFAAARFAGRFAAALTWTHDIATVSVDAVQARAHVVRAALLHPMQ